MQNESTMEIPVSFPAYFFCKITDQISVKTKVLIAVTIKIFFLGLVPYSFVHIYRYFGDTCKEYFYRNPERTNKRKEIVERI
jgi:hypothetical protein